MYLQFRSIRSTEIRWVALSVVLTVLIVLPSGVSAQVDGQPTEVRLFEGSYEIGQKRIPLPKGKWELILSSDRQSFTEGGSVSGKRAISYPVRRENGQITMAARIFANSGPGNGNGWTRNRRICDRRDVHFNESDRNYNPQEAECWQVNHFVNTYSYTSSNVMRQKFKSVWSAKFGTSTAIALDFTVNDAIDVMQVQYFILPVRYGFDSDSDINWKSSKWHPEDILDQPDKQKFIAAVKSFGEKILPLIRKGFNRSLKDEAASLDIEFAK